MRKKRVISLLLAITLSGLMAAGCAGKKEAGDSKPSTSDKPAVTSTGAGESSTNESSAKEKKIVIWHSFTQENRAAAIQEMADSYSAEHPDVKFEIEVFPWATFHTKWTTGLNAGNLPDISTALPDEATMMAQSDALLPMEDLIADMGQDAFLENPIKALTYNGNVIALPYYAHARILWYRTDLLAAKGINPPKTLDELAAAVKAVNDPPNVYGMALPLSQNDNLATLWLYIFSKNMGANIMKEDGTVDLTSPEMIKAITYMANLFKDGSPQGALNYGDTEINDAFVTGKSAFFFESGFAISRVESGNPEIADKIAAIYPPVENEGDTPQWMADYISVVRWKNSKYPDVTKDFVEYMYKPENYIKFLHLVPGGMLPTLKSVSESEEFYNDPMIQKHLEDVKKIQEGVANGCPTGADFGPKASINILKSQRVVEEMFQKIVLGEQDVATAAKEAEDKLNTEIAKLN